MIDRTPVFTFAAVTDSHLNPDEVENTSPWLTNRLANARSELVVDELNRLKPDFVIHIGDIIHPVPSSSLYAPAASYAKRLFAQLNCPLHLVPGNHDIGDKSLDWMPADQITEQFIERYRTAFGLDYGAFSHRGCSFIRINSSLLNSGLPQEAEQRRWMEQAFANAFGQRIFFFTHYPPFICRPDEESHYDNLDEPARSWLVTLLKRNNVEALFAGHVHNFFYNRSGQTRCYVLPSVTNLRQDYAEFFRIEPAEEYGRNDTAKLGFFLVDVYEDHHRVRFFRTNGLTAESSPLERTSISTAQEPISSPVGVHLRHQWAEEIELPHNGPLDELTRKRVRNDYGLLAMWDLGIDKVRVPISDLRSAIIRARIADFHDLGVRFTVFSFGVPDASVLSLLKEHRHFVDRWEMILPRHSLADAIRILLPSHRELPRIFLSKLKGHDSVSHDPTKPFDHSISIGFAPDVSSDLAEWLAQPDARSVFSGASFTINPGMPICDPSGVIAKVADQEKVSALVSVRVGPLVSAGTPPTESSVSARIAETSLCAYLYPRIFFLVDTFEQIDRGYFLRPGFVDRRCNLSAPGRMFRKLTRRLRELEPSRSVREIQRGNSRGLLFQAEAGECVLWLSDNRDPFVELQSGGGAMPS